MECYYSTPYYLNIVLFLCCIGIGIIGSIIHFVTTKKYKTRNLPPSPSPTLAIFGNLFSIGHSLHTSLIHLAKIHGPIMFLRLGQLPTVVFSSAAVVKEVVQKHDLTFSNRTVPDAIHALNHPENSLIFPPPTPKWRNLRKISNSHIFSTRKLDASRNTRESKVKDYLYSYVQNCANTGMVVDIGESGFNVVLNVLSTSLCSLDLGDPKSEVSSSFRKTFRDIIKQMGTPNVSDFFPIMRKIDVQGIRQRMGVSAQKIFDVFNEIIEERVRGRCLPNYVRCDDVLDTLLDMKPDEAEYIEATAIPRLFLELIVAGTDTTSNSFEWAMAELIHNPTKLKNLQAELEDTIGKGNPVQECHITKLPYLQAIIKETFRLHPPVPLPVRKVESNVNMFGYTIPANSMVLLNVWAIGRDPETWDNPDKFEPERFLGSKIDVKGYNFELIPFGVGRRICPGMPLANRIIPLMIASLVHEFDWTLENGVTSQNMNMEEIFGFTVQKAQRLRIAPFFR